MSLRKYIFRIPNIFYTFMFSSLAIVWGLWMLAPWSHFSLHLYGTHYAWGAFAFLSGAWTMIFSKLEQNKFLLGIFWQFLFWFFIAIATFVSDFSTPMWIVELFLAIMCGLGYINRRFWSE